MPSYTTKSDLEKSAGVNTSDFAKKADLPSLKSNVDKLDVDELKTVTIDLRKRSDVVKNNAIKYIVYHELVNDINTIDSDQQNLEKKIKDVHKKMSDTSKLIETQNCNKLRKTKFNVRIVGASENLATKNHK